MCSSRIFKVWRHVKVQWDVLSAQSHVEADSVVELTSAMSISFGSPSTFTTAWNCAERLS
jgi:hypothetical protein